ncbi:MAG: SPASM domain-containing protein [Candidatus Aminicenantes bacterium]|nr:SPASM domain-containing protein [Candidatus Aminicenantes bacterium]
MKKFLKRKIDLLPQRPEPFVFRMEITPEARWIKSALNQLLDFSTIIQLEAIEGLSDELLQIVQDLDRHPREPKIRLILPSSQNNFSSSFSSYAKPLSKLKKSTIVIFLASISHAQEPSLKNELLETIKSFSSAGLKTGLLVELAPTELASGIETEARFKAQLLALEELIACAAHAGALEMALRPSLSYIPRLRPNFSEKTSKHRPTEATDVSVSTLASLLSCLLSWINELKARGLVLSFEECFPLASSAPYSHLTQGLNKGFSLNLNPNPEPNFKLNLGPNLNPNLDPNNFTNWPMPNCRQAFGSCFIDRNGLIKPCRLSEYILGDLKEKQLKDIFSSFIFSDRHYCFSSFPATSSSSLNTPVRLDSGLKPVPLFQLLHRNWGSTLVHGYDSLLLSHKGVRLARSIDGRHNLRWFKKKFGAKALSFICGLFLKGYIRLEE